MRKKRATVKYGICEDCGIETSISQRNLCSACSLNREIETAKEMREREGEKYERWKAGVIRGIGKRMKEMKRNRK